MIFCFTGTGSIRYVAIKIKGRTEGHGRYLCPEYDGMCEERVSVSAVATAELQPPHPNPRRIAASSASPAKYRVLDGSAGRFCTKTCFGWLGSHAWKTLG